MRVALFVWRAQEPLAAGGLEQALETHARQSALYPSARLAAWPDADRSTRIVFIGRDLEEGAIAQIFQSFTPAASHSR